MRNVKTVVMTIGIALAFSSGVHAQMAVLDAGVASLLAATKADQLVYYGQSLMEMYNNAQNTYNQFQNLLRAEQRIMNNLKSVANVKSFDDFMKWHNRQLYLEKERESRIPNMGVKIGEKTYKLKDIQEIPDALRQNYGDEYWGDFSEAQRKEMYTRMGLSPSNYVYLQTWKEREKQIADELLTKTDIINDENMEAYANYKETVEKYANDKNKPENEKIDSKEIGMDSLMAQIETNKILRGMAYDAAKYNEYLLAQEKLSKNPVPPPRLSDTYNDSPFQPITSK
jgi:hypothetical protein